MHPGNPCDEDDVSGFYLSRRESLKINEDFDTVVERRKTQNLEFVAVPIQKLYGNLFMEYEGKLLNKGFKEGNFNESLQSLRKYRINSKNYANMFLIKGKVMVDILGSLLPKFESTIQQSFSYYEIQVGVADLVRTEEARQDERGISAAVQEVH